MKRNERGHNLGHWMHAAVCILGGMLALGSTGCQVEMAGQTLPSAYYMTDTPQYYAPGPEFKLANEAAYLQQFKDQRPDAPAAFPTPQ